jgi:hypothetical protein
VPASRSGGVQIWSCFATASTVLKYSWLLELSEKFEFCHLLHRLNPVQTGAKDRPKAGPKVYGEVTL